MTKSRSCLGVARRRSCADGRTLLDKLSEIFLAAGILKPIGEPVF
jgi:hypothetical protein